MKYLPILLRFSVYGFVTFGVFGYMLQNPYVTTLPANFTLILSLGLAGAISFPVSAGAVLILLEISKELTRND